MNLIHRWYCASPLWRRHVRSLLPWATSGVQLSGAKVLELGSGPGLTTDWLIPRVGQLTALEYDERHTIELAARQPSANVVHGDATDMPFDDGSFDLVVCFTMLHHVASAAAQDRLLKEARRVLRTGGVFAGSDSRWTPLFGLAHVGDTMVLVDVASLDVRLVTAGFDNVVTSRRRDALRFRATAPVNN